MSLICVTIFVLDVAQNNQRGYITVGYRGSFAFGSAGLADVKFRKLSRILVHGRVILCRDVFGESLNESRDPDHGESDRYTSRFFLKHSSLEQAFDCLQEAGFKWVPFLFIKSKREHICNSK